MYPDGHQSFLPANQHQDDKIQPKDATGGFGLDIWKHFFMERIIMHWNGQARKVFESLSLEVFKKLMNVALNSLVYKVMIGERWDLMI